MGFLTDLFWIAGGIVLLCCAISEPKPTFWCVTTLGCGYIGRAESGLGGTIVGLVLGGAAAGVVVLLWIGIQLGIQAILAPAKPLPVVHIGDADRHRAET